MDLLKTVLGNHALTLAVLLIGMISGVLIAWRVSLRFQRRRGRKEREYGLKAEKKAARLLRKQGYRILETNPRFRHHLMVDGEKETFEITPDLLVEKDNQTYVVEIKSNDADVAVAGVRRQILEYLIASNLPCLLVIMPEGIIDLIQLPRNSKGMHVR